ncbi:MAG: HAMP domain-containing histidine kinase [Spirochaetaceae bacterium]|jgi:two-component system sensor histidine kinase HydH|nr:HAMP domain-containing histidine kinase [Spirochaetaceae bacterium]
MMSRRHFSQISQTSSFIGALLCWGLSSLIVFLAMSGIQDRARLIMENDNERIFNSISMIRQYEDFASLIENSALGDRITGFAVYDEELQLEYAWGTVPPFFNPQLLAHQKRNRYGRYVIFNPQEKSIVQVMHNENAMPAARRSPPPRANNNGTERLRMPPLLFFTLYASGKYVYLAVDHTEYWQTQVLVALLFPLCELAILILVFYIRHLYLRNREYRERIEAQKNLVVLGTAASTLAHEIKNPLLSIRIQTGILKKLLAGTGQEEIAIIEEEVERLQALAYRVNDYLRDAEGEPVCLNCYDILAETALRLCGRNIMHEDSIRNAAILMDPNRVRSVFENIIRNALESGSPPDAINAQLARCGTRLGITITDRGSGIAPEQSKRIFDPFFTSKSTGTGIGLSISRRFIEAAGGSIHIENRIDGGTAVYITLPEERSQTALAPPQGIL